MKRFIHGNTYYSHAHPPEELDRNFKKMLDLGMNAVRVAEIWPGWSVIEHDPGKYDYALLDDYVEKAAANGIKICMGIGINDTPFWLYSKYPDLRCVNVDGRLSTRRVQSACVDHREYRCHMKEFIINVTKRYAGEEGIFSWQFGNEVRSGVALCDCPSTRARFREWLKHKYNDDIDALNREWGVYYRNWEEIYPYKSSQGPPTEGVTGHYLNSAGFKNWTMEELVRWGVGIIKQYTEKPVLHNNFQQTDCGSYWKLTEPCDAAVMDIYAITYEEPGIYNGFLLDITRSIADQQGKPLWIGETTAGQYGTYNRIFADRRVIENCVAEQIGAGAEAVFYFRHKAPVWEQPHKFTGSQTFLRIDESEMEYAKTPRKIAAFMERHEHSILSAETLRPEVGIYFPAESIALGAEAGYREDAQHSAYGSRAIWAGNQIPVEMLDTDSISDMDISRFKIIHLPVSYLLPSRVGEALKKYVAEGGTLICEGRPGYVNEYGLLHEVQPGAGLDEVLGAREDLFYNINSFKARVSLDSFDKEVLMTSIKQTYRLMGGEPFITTDQDEICGVKNRYGKGQAYIFGGAPSLHYRIGKGKYESGKSSTDVDAKKQRIIFCKIFKNLGLKHGVTAPLKFNGGIPDLTARYLKNDNKLIVFLVNYSPVETAEIMLHQHFSSIHELTEEGKNRLDGGRISVPGLGWKAFEIET